MNRIEKTVFISYRRTNAAWALAVYQHLTHHHYDVFFDFTGIASGDFEGAILQNIRARAHFLVLLTPSALERLHEPGDWLRRELECAMDERRNIVPLFFEGFDIAALSTGGQLSGKLAAVKRYNGLTVPVEYFDAAMEKLRVKYLNVPLEAVLHPATTEAVTVATAQRRSAAEAPTVAPNELTASAWFEKGVAAVDPEEKLRCNTEAIRLNPVFGDAYNNRGNARQDLGDLDGALADYNEALRLYPDYAMAYGNRGVVRKAQGDLDGALADYETALRLDPEDADYWYNRGALRLVQGDLDGALADNNEAIRLNPDYVKAFNNRGEARRLEGDLDGALADYNEALRLDPDYPDAYNNRGIVRKDQGDLDGALADYNEALRLNPDDAQAYTNRATVRLLQREDIDGALADYAEALRIDPECADTYFNRGIVLEVLGDYQGAIQDFEKYLELGGSDQADVEAKISDLRTLLEGEP